MDCAISELCYKETILLRKYLKITIFYNSIVKFHGQKIWEPEHDCVTLYIQIHVIMRCVIRVITRCVIKELQYTNNSRTNLCLLNNILSKAKSTASSDKTWFI